MNPAFEILARKAFAKVVLNDMQKRLREIPPTASPGQFTVALKEFRAANREQKKLDAEYREHHEALALAEDVANSTPLLNL